MLSKQEFYRQILHTIIGLIVLVLIYLNLLSSRALFLMVIAGVLASILSKRIRLPFFSFFLKHCEREEMKKTFPGKGMIFFFIGVLLSVQLFEKDIALGAIMVLTFGDSVSHLFGAQLGKLKNIFNGKSRKLFEGTLAGAVSGFLAASIFVPFTEAFLGSFAAMFAEVIKIDLNEYTLDDNLIVPLIAGTVMFLVRTFVSI
ncbi:MAG: diacylglycerol/polyprenol kinase family protein [Nanoarchaeota archaeon]